MIRSFRDLEAQSLFARGRSRRHRDIERAATRKLRILHAALSLNDLAANRGNRLESLVGNRRGQHGIRINDQWRICFTWKNGDAFEVEIVDYHH